MLTGCEMKQWVLSVAGMAILSVIADIVLPNGQTRKYIKTVIGIVVTLVVVQPVFALFRQNNLSTATEESYQPQQEYLGYVANLQQSDVENLHSVLTEAGFDNCAVYFDVKSNCLVAVFSEKFSAERYERAQTAVSLARCKSLVKYCWNNTE